MNNLGRDLVNHNIETELFNMSSLPICSSRENDYEALVLLNGKLKEVSLHFFMIEVGNEFTSWQVKDMNS